MVSQAAQNAGTGKRRKVSRGREALARRDASSMSFYEYLQALIAKHPEWAKQDKKKLEAVSAYALKLMEAIGCGIRPPESLHELFRLEYDHWHDTVLVPAEQLYYQYVDAQLEANPQIFENFRKSMERSARDMKPRRQSRPARLR
jgi:hypothetical protein